MPNEADLAFFEAFKTQTLPFEEWTHRAHIRAAWMMLGTHAMSDLTNWVETALPMMRSHIQAFNKVNADKVKVGYHETMTHFWVLAVARAMHTAGATTFDVFAEKNSHLFTSGYVWRFYDRETLFGKDSCARQEFVAPTNIAEVGL